MNAKRFTIFIVILLIALIFWMRSDGGNNGGEDFKNATYYIEGKPVTLFNGMAESEAAPGSASKIITKYFGFPIKNDFNGDKIQDEAFVITQETGGSGTFYYLLAALNNGKAVEGTNAAFIGDRIKIQSVDVINAEIVIKYSEREGQSVVKYFKFEGSTFVEDKK